VNDRDKQAKTVRVLRSVPPTIGTSRRHLIILVSFLSAFFKALILLVPPSQSLKVDRKNWVEREDPQGVA